MKKIVKIVSILMAVIVLTAFTDVDKTHWAYSYVENAKSLGLISGIDEKGEYFEPDSDISKQEVAYLLHSAYCRINPLAADVDYSSECAVTLEKSGIDSWAAKKLSFGFVMGYWNENDFSGGGSSDADRVLIASWIDKMFPHKTFALRVLDFADAKDIAAEYYGAVDTMVKYGIMQGAEGLFYPNESITRAESAAVTVGLMEILSADYKKPEIDPYLYIYGELKIENDNDRLYLVGDKLINIAEDAKLIIDGKKASLSDIKSLKGKKISMSSYLDGEHTDSVIIQSTPFLQNGSIEGYSVKKNLDGSDTYHQLVTIRVDGVSIDYVANDETIIIGNITGGSEVQFIADGIYLLEIE